MAPVTRLRYMSVDQDSSPGSAYDERLCPELLASYMMLMQDGVREECTHARHVQK
jgi:hypothetical protein